MGCFVALSLDRTVTGMKHSGAMTLNGNKVVVVGGTSGIGLATAHAVVDRGARVVLVGRSADKLASARESFGADTAVEGFTADVAREEEVATLMERVGTFDHLVVTAIAPGYAPIASIDVAVARSVLDSKLLAAILLAKHAHGRLRPGGSITLTSGIAKDRPMAGGAVVAAVNGALGALARALTLEMAPSRVNVVSPGWVETPVWDFLLGERKTEAWAQMGRRLPVGRIGAPSDLAAAYLFLMENTFAAGTTVHVDGGHALV
jgi:NAD(P)-dependent dehydrogenase (short-subunit alcohol dehydrogenase family)